MKVLVICGNPKSNGMTNRILEMFEQILNKQKVKLERINLKELNFSHCQGCQECIREGTCAISDDLDMVKKKMQEADGLILSSPVRDNYPTALFKKFYERLSYPFGFTLKLKDKPIVAVSTVGVMGGKKMCRNFIGLKPFWVKEVGFIYEKVGFDKKFKDLGKLENKINTFSNKLIKNMSSQNSIKRGGISLNQSIFKLFVHSKKEHMPYVHREWFKREGVMKIFRLLISALFLFSSCFISFADKAESNNYETLWKTSKDYSKKGLLADSRKEKERDYQKAIDLARKAVSENPNKFDGYLCLAESLGKMSIFKGVKTKVRFAREIRKAAEKAIELAPNEAKPYMILGIWHYNVGTASWIEKKIANIFLGGLPKGSLKESLEYLEKALKLDPKFNKNYLELGRAYLAMKDKNNAKSIWLDGLKIEARDKSEERTKREIKENLKILQGN